MHKLHGKWLFTLSATLALTSIALLVFAKEKQRPEDIVAVVNGSGITRADFDGEMNRIRQSLIRVGKPPGDSELSRIRNDALENLIDRELLYQESQKKGIKVDEATVKVQLRKLKERFPNEAEFQNMLSRSKLSEGDIKSDLRRSMAVKKFVDEQFVPKATVSEKEIKAFYDGNPNRFKQPEQVRASHILIKIDPRGNESQKAEARKKIEKVRQKVQKGADFAVLAKEFSQCPSSSKGGDLGYFGRKKMAKPFEQAAFALKPGEVSGIVETKFGYHLIKVTDKKPETTIPYEDIKVKLGQILKGEKVRQEARKYVEKLKEKAKVEKFLTEDKSPKAP
jgi:peptidyl-prolyl cis-trans isomerase C